MSSLTAMLFSVAAIHLTTLLSLSLPTSFAAMAAPASDAIPIPEPEPEQQPTVTPAATGSSRRPGRLGRRRRISRRYRFRNCNDERGPAGCMDHGNYGGRYSNHR